MKSPVWIINSSLLLLLICSLIYILFSLGKLFETPQITQIKISKVIEAQKGYTLPKNLQKIFEENDLFGTYRPAITLVPQEEQLPMLPPPPAPRPIMPKGRPTIQFLEPLPIRITGIIASTTENNSQFTVINTTTKKSSSYKIGDKVFDAYVLRIMSQKVIIVRSNGQQETLFMFPEDAKKELVNLKDVNWKDVVQEQRPQNYLINPTTFITRVRSLANLVEMMNITTATTENKSVGLRVGKMDKNSIGSAFGFMPGDVVTKIADIAPTSTENRTRIFNDLARLNMGGNFKIQFIRNGQMMTYTYTLYNLADQAALETMAVSPILEKQRRSAHHIGPESYMKELEQEEQEAMRLFGGKPPELT